MLHLEITVVYSAFDFIDAISIVFNGKNSYCTLAKDLCNIYLIELFTDIRCLHPESI